MTPWQLILSRTLAGLCLVLAIPVTWFLLLFLAVVRQDGYLNTRVDPLLAACIVAALLTPALFAATSTNRRLRRYLGASLVVALLTYSIWIWTIPVI